VDQRLVTALSAVVASSLLSVGTFQNAQEAPHLEDVVVNNTLQRMHDDDKARHTASVVNIMAIRFHQQAVLCCSVLCCAVQDTNRTSDQDSGPRYRVIPKCGSGGSMGGSSGGSGAGKRFHGTNNKLATAREYIQDNTVQ
jgi:hypothetical protein